MISVERLLARHERDMERLEPTDLTGMWCFARTCGTPTCDLGRRPVCLVVSVFGEKRWVEVIAGFKSLDTKRCL